MRIINNQLSEKVLFLLLILTGVFFYWGFLEVKNLISNFTLLFLELADISLGYKLYSSIALEVVIVIVIISWIVWVIRVDQKAHQESAIELGKPFLKKLGIIVVSITIVNRIFNIIWAQYSRIEIRAYVEEHYKEISTELIMLQSIATVIGALSNLLVFVLFFLVVSKLKDSSKGTVNL